MLPNPTYKQLQTMITETFVLIKDKDIIGVGGRPASWLFDFKKMSVNGVFLQIWVEHFWEKMAPAGDFQVGGLEVGAVPLVSAITLEGHRRGRTVNGFFIRKSRKKSGRMDQVEGLLNSDPIILVDDMINSGNSFAKQIAIIDAERQQVGEDKIGKVAMLCTVVTFRKTTDYAEFNNRNITIKTIFTLDDFKHLGLQSIRSEETNKQQKIKTSVVWRHRAKNPLFFPVVPKPELLLLEKNLIFTTDDGFIKCLNKNTGESQWQYQVVLGRKKKDIFSTPVYCAGQIIFGSRDGNLYALSAESGQRSWVCFEADWIQGSPAVSPELGLVFAPLSFGLFRRQGKVVALEASTGEIKWGYEIPASLSGGIHYDTNAKVVVFGTDDGTVYSLDARSGRLLWQQSTPFLSVSFPAIDPKLGVIFLTGLPLNKKEGVGYLYAMNLKTGVITFIFKDFQFGSFSTPLLSDNKLYFAALDKQLYTLDTSTGQLLWQRDLEARCFASPTLVRIDNVPTICIGANNGRLNFFEPTNGTPLGVINLTERLLNKSVYDEEINNLFVITQANELLAIKLAKE